MTPDAGEDGSTRDAIRAAATTLFAARGFDAVTVRQIAAEAGVSPGLVLHHFGSKAGLQEAVVARVQEWFDDMLGLAEGRNAMEALEDRNWDDLLDQASTVFDGDDTLPDLLVRLVAEDDPFATGLVGGLIQRSEQTMDAYVRAGVLVDDPTPELRAALLVAMDLGVLLLRRQLIAHLGFDPHRGEGMKRWAAVSERVFAALFVTPQSHPTDLSDTEE